MKGQACSFPLNDKIKTNMRIEAQKRNLDERKGITLLSSALDLKEKKKLLPHQQRWGRYYV